MQSSAWVCTASLVLLLGFGIGTAALAADAEDPEMGTVLIDPGGGERLWVNAESADELGSGGEFHIYVDPETHPDAKASFAKFSLGPGGALPVHRHERSEEFGYFLAGEGVVSSFRDGQLQEFPVQEGSVWYIPQGAWHSIGNTGEGLLTLVFATVPNEETGLLSFFRSISAPPGEEPPNVPPEEFARLAAEHDLILLPEQPEK